MVVDIHGQVNSVGSEWQGQTRGMLIIAWEAGAAAAEERIWLWRCREVFVVVQPFDGRFVLLPFSTASSSLSASIAVGRPAEYRSWFTCCWAHRNVGIVSPVGAVSL